MTSADSEPRWTRLEHDERRAQILACARRLFADRHYSAVSTTEIARDAGVARGLLHHYFGTKRDLYLEVVRTMVRLPPPIPEGDLSTRSVDDLLDETIGGWLEMVSRNRATWFAALGVEGLGPDPEVEAVLESAREGVVDRYVEILSLKTGTTDSDGPEVRAALRSASGLAEAATREWLLRGRLDRRQTHLLITATLRHVVDEIVPRLLERRVTPTPEDS